MGSAAQTNPASRLPAEIICRVANLIPPESGRETLQSFSLTCRAFRDPAQRLLFREIKVRESDGDEWTLRLQTTSHLARAVRKIDLGKVRPMEDPNDAGYLSCAQAIKLLSLTPGATSVRFTSAPVYHQVAGEEGVYDGNPMGDAFWAALRRLAGLRELVIASDKLADAFRGLSSFGPRRCLRFVRVSYQWCNGPSKDEVAGLADVPDAVGRPSVRHLKLTGDFRAPPLQTLFHWMANVRLLEVPSLTRGWDDRQLNARWPACLSQLEGFGLEDGRTDFDTSLSRLMCASMPLLRHLRITVAFFYDVSAQLMLDSFPLLETLSIRWPRHSPESPHPAMEEDDWRDEEAMANAADCVRTLAKQGSLRRLVLWTWQDKPVEEDMLQHFNPPPGLVVDCDEVPTELAVLDSDELTATMTRIWS